MLTYAEAAAQKELAEAEAAEAAARRELEEAEEAEREAVEARSRASSLIGANSRS
jgi:hypothetical protein